MSHPEAQIQMAIADYLALQFPRGKSDVLFFAIPNEQQIGGKGAAITGARLNRMGRLKGVADICLILASPVDVLVFFAEVKSPKGRLTDSQKSFRDECRRLDIPWALWRSLDDCQQSLDDWGLTDPTPAPVPLDRVPLVSREQVRGGSGGRHGA